MTAPKPQHRLTNKDLDNLTADCAVCGPGVRIKWKHQGRNRPKYVACTWKTNQPIKNTPGHKRRQSERRSRHHGMTRTERSEYLQGKVCAVCGTTEDLRVDHCHDTGVIRDPLCNRHNVGLGMFGDSVTELLAAVDYLARHGKDDRP